MKQAVLLNDTSFDNHFGCEVVMRNIFQALKEREISVSFTCPVGHHWQTDPKCIAAFKTCDIIIVNGEGTIHHGKKRGKWLVEVASYAKALNKPAVLINTTYQDNDASFIPHLEAFQRIYVRETLSQQALKQQGIPSIVVPDMTFYSTYPEHRQHSEKRMFTIGYSDSVLDKVSRKLYILSRQQGNRATYLPVFSNFKIKQPNIKRVIKKAKFLIHRQLGRTLGKFLPIKMKYISYAYLKHSIDDYIKAVTGVDLFVIGRFHALCFSIQTTTPFVTFSSNTYKVEGLIKDIGLNPERIMTFETFTQLDPDTLYEKFGDFSQDEMEHIKNYKSEALHKINMMFDEIKTIAYQT